MSIEPVQMTETVSARTQPGISEKNRLARMEPVLLVIGLLAFFLINFFTADKTPAVWCDEVMYQDPAVNLSQGHGFCSAAWFAQDMDKFWAGNVPLYQFVLFGWLKVFGFSLHSVRSLHYRACQHRRSLRMAGNPAFQSHIRARAPAAFLRGGLSLQSLDFCLSLRAA